MLRGATYYYRRVVPQDLRDTFGQREVQRSLRTGDYAEACSRARAVAAEVEANFIAHRQHLHMVNGDRLERLTPEQVKRVEDAYYAHLLDEDEEERLGGFDDLDEPTPEEDLPETPRRTWEEKQETQEFFAEVNREDMARGEAGQFWRGEADEVLYWSNVALPLAAGSESWPRVFQALQRATVRAAESIRQRDRGEVAETPQGPSVAPVVTPSGFPLLSVAMAAWLKEKLPVWGDKAGPDHEHWARVFVATTGDRPIDSYSKIDGRKFEQLVQTLPANWGKKPALRGLAIEKAAEKAAKLDLPPMSVTNANKAIRRVQAFWTWAAANYFDGPAPGPLRGLLIPQRINPRDQRHPFSPAQLQGIFSAPTFTGCASDRRWKEPGEHVPVESSRYWLPLLSLFTGARLGELCQLQPTDVREEGGIAFIRIEGDGGDKRVKTPAANRNIPLHPQLIALGFPELARRRREAGADWLFEDFANKPRDVRIDSFSKHFARFLDACGAKTSKTAFHSFRHNFEDACRAGRVEASVMNALQGHTQEGMAGRYGLGEYPLGILREAVESISYLGLSLEHLRGFGAG